MEDDMRRRSVEIISLGRMMSDMERNVRQK
jgi:hypothetical protein